MNTKSLAEKQALFKKSSTTYYYSSLFFTGEVKKDVFTLYAFVRYADDLVDAIPAKADEFYRFRKATENAFNGRLSKNHIIDDFIQLSKRKNFDQSWTIAFLDSMERDLSKKSYETYEELQGYMYGSADVIGLYMCRIFDTSDVALEYAQKQGEAMQFINFIRDIQEDSELGRQYIPRSDARKFNTHIPPHPVEYENFCNLIRYEIQKYRALQLEADKGHSFIDRRFRIMVKTSAAMYSWTADRIEENPLIVLQKKVKPSKWFVIANVIKNALVG